MTTMSHPEGHTTVDKGSGDLMTTIATQEDSTTLYIFGPMTERTTSTLEDQLRLALDRTPAEHIVRVDMHNCTAIDQDGLNALINARQAATLQDVGFHLFHVPPTIARTLHQHGKAHLMDIPWI